MHLDPSQETLVGVTIGAAGTRGLSVSHDGAASGRYIDACTDLGHGWTLGGSPFHAPPSPSTLRVGRGDLGWGGV